MWGGGGGTGLGVGVSPPSHFLDTLQLQDSDMEIVMNRNMTIENDVKEYTDRWFC